jgi:hypothetical protein
VKSIRLVGVGLGAEPAPAAALRTLEAALPRVFHVPCHIRPGTVDISAAYDPNRAQYYSTDVLRRLAPLVGPGTVLVAHPPPRGTLDEAFGRFHAGSAALRDLVLRREPAVLLCGHIHESRGEDAIAATRIVNPGPAASGHCAVVDVGDVGDELSVTLV